MKKKNLLRIVSSVLTVFCLFQTIIIKAFDSEEHNRMMRNSLFRKGFFKYYGERYIEDKENEYLLMLEDASYLVLDQYNDKDNHKGSKTLEHLKSLKVTGLPVSINEIDFSGNSSHRAYTHLGWNHNYLIDKANWNIRKTILLNTVDRIFKFDSTQQKDSFAAIIYYIHLLGDRKCDTDGKSDAEIKHSEAKNIMEVGGRHSTDKNDIIDELLIHIKVVFKNQTNTHKFRQLVNRLERENAEFEKIVRSDGGVYTTEKIKEYGKLTDKVCKTITYYLPEMLKNEAFFRNVFY